MFPIIYCFAPLFLTLYQIYLVKKRTSVVWSIKKGEICYHCKQSLNVENDVILGRLMHTKDFSQLCVLCNRDRKIEQLKKPYSKWKFEFFKFLISDKFQKLNLIFMIVVMSTIVLDIILIFSGYRFGLWKVYGTVNFIFYFISIYRTFYTTIKKPSE